MTIKNQERFTILAVDDEPKNIKILEDILSENYEFTGVQSGEEALKMIYDYKPDVVLLDIMMKKIDGYEVCRTIKKDDELQFTKVILVSAMSKLEERMKGYEVGADDYITKPFDIPELLAKVKIFLKLKYSEEINVLKNKILQLCSHETNTPLSGIIMAADFLAESTDISKENKIYVETILACAKQLLYNTKKTLLLCELKNMNNLEKKSYELDDFFLKIIHNLKDLLNSKKITINLHNTVKKTVYINQDLFYTALISIIENAVKYSPENSEIAVNIKQTDNTVQIMVSDKGEGIKQKPVEQIFDEFSVQDLDHHHKGLGISLAISRHIAQLHGGELTAKNNSKQGATFTFSFPI